MSDNLPPLPDLNRLAPFVEGLGKAILREMIDDLAAIEADRVSRDMPADLAAVLLELDTPIAGLLGSHSGKFVPGTSKDSKEFDAFESAIPLVRWTDHERTCRKIAALAASPQPQPVQAQPSGWQPIETAPDDMTEPVLVFWIDSDGAPMREFDYKEDGCWIGWHEHAEHVHVIGGHGVSYTPPYTSWMQLPPPPANQQKDHQ